MLTQSFEFFIAYIRPSAIYFNAKNTDQAMQKKNPRKNEESFAEEAVTQYVLHL